MEKIDILTIRKRSIHGIFALISRAFFINILSYIASLFVFTLLSPRDVGIYIAVTAIQRVISFVTDFGFGAALIQKKDMVTNEDIKTTFTLQILVSGSLFILILLLRNVFFSFFNLDDAAGRLLIVLVFTIFLSSFKVIPSILLEREIQFKKLILPQIVESLIFNMALIYLVTQAYGIDSYSIAFLVSGLVGIPFYYYVSPWKISIGIHKESLQHLHYGLRFQAKNVLATLKDDFLTLFLSKVLAFTELGYIGFGQRNSFFIYRYIVDSMTKVTFSTFSRLQNNTEYLKKVLEKSLFYVASITFPVLTGLIIIAPYVIAYFPKWQSKWEPAILSLVFFSLNAMISSLSGILINVLDATGHVKTSLKMMVFWTILTWILTPIAIKLYGYNGVAIASFFVTLTIFMTIRYVKKTVPFDFWKSVYKPIIATMIMGCIVYVISSIFITNIISIGAVIIIGGLVYGIVYYLLHGAQLKEDIKSLR